MECISINYSEQLVSRKNINLVSRFLFKKKLICFVYHCSLFFKQKINIYFILVITVQQTIVLIIDNFLIFIHFYQCVFTKLTSKIT